jgi:hypothetical protein
VENLYDQPNDLDPQPEYPLRSELIFYKPPGEEDALRPLVDILGATDGSGGLQNINAGSGVEALQPYTSPFPPASIMLSLWVFGLILWCMTFMNPGRMGSGGGSKGKKQRRTKINNSKDV